MTDAPRDYIKEALAPPLQAVNVFDFLATEFPPRELLLAPWLPRQGVAMIAAPRGVGKTWVAVGCGYAVATGTEFLRWTAPAPRRVLLLDGEMPATVLQERVRAAQNAIGIVPPDWDYLKIIAADMQELGLPDRSEERRVGKECRSRWAA